MRIILIILLFIQVKTFAQTSETKIFPSDLNIQPFTANFLEPKLGFMFEQNKNELRLNIGNSVDILQKEISGNITFSIGADLFTYTLLRGEKDFHFPVDAVDYLFGLNAGIKKEFGENEIGMRFRLSHISAHFVDGHFDWETNYWRDSLNPKVYSREFIEIIPYYSLNKFRIYGGATYLYHVDPENAGKFIYHLGFDKFFENLFYENLHPFVAYDLRFQKIEKYRANNTIQAGIKYGKAQGRGISIHFEYFNGKNIHGEYFGLNEEYSAIGINLDL